MVFTYNVIDVMYFFDDVPGEEVYLVINTSENQEENIARKIKISSRRFIDVFYSKKEKVQVLVKNDETNNYDIMDIPYENGVYQLYSFLLDIYWDVQPVMLSEWTDIKECYLEKMSKFTISDYAILLEHSDNYIYDIKLLMLTETKLQDTEVVLKKVSCHGLLSEIDIPLFDKCIKGNSISVEDFLGFTEDIDRGIWITLDFDSISFHLTHDRVSIQKSIGSEYGINELFSCTLSNTRVGMVSILFAKIMKTETEKNTMQFLSDYYLT